MSSSLDTSDSVGRERERRRSHHPLSGGGCAGPTENIRRTVTETWSAVMTAMRKYMCVRPVMIAGHGWACFFQKKVGRKGYPKLF